MKNNRFWKYFVKWRDVFTKPEKLAWADGLLENGYCASCRYCCGPQGDDEPFPMALLPDQISARTTDDFYLLNSHTAYLGREGCKSLSSTGCALPRKLRPISCSLFPLVLANGRLYLYKTCPAVIFNNLAKMADLGQKAAEWLKSLPMEDLRQISLDLSSEKLASDYIDLGLEVFDDDRQGAKRLQNNK